MNPSASPELPADSKPVRLVSLDAYRGFIMLAMASSFGGALAKLAKQPGFTGNQFLDFFTFQFEHVRWEGCSFWDLIQPSFMFMVGVAMPYSYASRKAKGDSEARLFAHVLLRSLVLIVLGIFLSSNSSKQTNFTFVNVLTQIGLGYTFVYLFLGKGFRLQLLTVAVILVSYWLWFLCHPLPGPDFDYAAVKTSADERFSGWFAHWDKNTNFAAAVDLWFLNLFPQPEPFRFNVGGYQTLNFVPSMATMLFGLMAGEMLRGPRSSRDKFLRLVLAGFLCLGLGALLGYTWCPLVKRIWTPSWAVFSTGWTFLMLAAFFWIIDMQGYKGWAFPLVVVGMNSILMYCMAQLCKPWIKSTLQIHFGQDAFTGTYGAVVESLSVLFVLWLVCLWLFRQRIFVRI